MRNYDNYQMLHELLVKKIPISKQELQKRGNELVRLWRGQKISKQELQHRGDNLLKQWRNV